MEYAADALRLDRCCDTYTHTHKMDTYINKENETERERGGGEGETVGAACYNFNSADYILFSQTKQKIYNAAPEDQLGIAASPPPPPPPLASFSVPDST